MNGGCIEMLSFLEVVKEKREQVMLVVLSHHSNLKYTVQRWRCRPLNLYNGGICLSFPWQRISSILQ